MIRRRIATLLIFVSLKASRTHRHRLSFVSSPVVLKFQMCEWIPKYKLQRMPTSTDIRLFTVWWQPLPLWIFFSVASPFLSMHATLRYLTPWAQLLALSANVTSNFEAILKRLDGGTIGIQRSWTQRLLSNRFDHFCKDLQNHHVPRHAIGRGG